MPLLCRYSPVPVRGGYSAAEHGTAHNIRGIKQNHARKSVRFYKCDLLFCDIDREVMS